uniref:Uncharacterized protein n=1 Tax=Mycena chlorophos TaxID=658473 RepID=A0ABQ0LEV9_MYCCL|nr:predicted protein [Mycena chlorophos]
MVCVGAFESLWQKRDVTVVTHKRISNHNCRRRLNTRSPHIFSLYSLRSAVEVNGDSFVATVYINLTVASKNPHNRVMFGVSVVLFVIATMHLAMNPYRLIHGLIIFCDRPGGPAYLGVLEYWDHIFKDTLASSATPLRFIAVSTVSGYMVCGLYTTVDPSATVFKFNPRLANWITTFYSIAVAQNIMTTSLMAYRLWSVDARSAAHRIHRCPFIHVLRILVESAALYLFVEILLSLYSINLNAQYILLEIVPPIVGITINVITIRINMRSFDERKEATGVSVGSHPVQTLGSLPMRRMVIRRDVEAITDADTDEPGIYVDRKPTGAVKADDAV